MYSKLTLKHCAAHKQQHVCEFTHSSVIASLYLLSLPRSISRSLWVCVCLRCLCVIAVFV